MSISVGPHSRLDQGACLRDVLLLTRAGREADGGGQKLEAALPEKKGGGRRLGVTADGKPGSHLKPLHNIPAAQ